MQLSRVYGKTNDEIRAGLSIVPVVPLPWERAPRRQGPQINYQFFNTLC